VFAGKRREGEGEREREERGSKGVKKIART